ncbi:hypothetical protein EW145_g3811 [Phellinidium pouzarii]|uniref:Anaphase-promoting complex subunit 5 n=1 Tax=Phellinidium pouzarii TaxID=167371 RepID=A0A4S4L686_9AGAM|nr:hypothetical protein EW145_g3811 [Phellinidium pouzarii]
MGAKVKDNNTPATPQSQALTRARKRRRSSSPSDGLAEKKRALETLPPSVLLLTVPELLAVPPNHKQQITSYVLSLAALRKCLGLGSLPPDIEVRAWTALAELGLKIVRAGWSRNNYYPWAGSLELEVENAIGKGLLLVQQNPARAVYKQMLTLLHSRLAHWQQNEKYSRILLKRLVSIFPSPNSTTKQFEVTRTPSWLVYTTHLTAISHALSTVPPDHKLAFSTIQDLFSASEQLEDPPVKLLTHVLRLRTLVDAGMWESVSDSLTLAESVLGVSYDISSSSTSDKGKKKEEFMCFEDPFEAAMAIHTLIMGVVYYTHLGQAKASSLRLSHLHALLDSDVLEMFPNGTIDITLSSGPPLTIKTTHPRVLYHLAYLVSSVSKRDAVGRKPKRKIFANEGLTDYVKEVKKEITLHPWADPRDAEEIDERMVKIRADLLSELIAVCIMRSEFDEASKNLEVLIAHTRSYGFFPTYAARITLHHAHLAHALGDANRAAKCYAVAAHLAQEGTFVNVSARVSHLALRIACGEGGRVDLEWEAEVSAVVEACKGMGGTLEAIGHILQASISPEILTAKTHLKVALDHASAAQDNHLRALILALISALYLRTAEDHARAMLETCRQLAAGLGAPQKSSKDGQPPKDDTSNIPTGNAPLGLWVGQRLLEIYRREGDEAKAQRQEAINSQLSVAVEQLSEKRQALLNVVSS